MTEPVRDVKKLGVVGAGQMGQGIAQVGTPVDDLGLPAVEADRQAGAGGTEVQGIHR